jgi:uncharacterized protein
VAVTLTRSERSWPNTPALARARLGAADEGTKTSLHLVTDWPGYFPNGPDVVKLLISAGADPSAPATGRNGDNGETPLRWAASSDDVDVAAALIDAGADIEAPGGSIRGRPGQPTPHTARPRR